MKSEKVIAYIDGFNLYFGLKDKGWRKYYWLNVKSLCQYLLKPHQHLVIVKYFTSRITKHTPAKRKRQSTYIEALNTIQGIQLFYGKYEWSPIECKNCGHKDEVPKEKITDVQLGVELVSDAYQNNFNTALLVTGDIDLVPSIEKLKTEFPNKHAIVVFPPMRSADELRGAAYSVLHINESLLKKSQLPDAIPKLGGYTLKRPPQWT